MFSGLNTEPVPHTSAATSSAISRYSDYLEGVYRRSSVSSDCKFPPTPSKTYVNLAVVERASEICDMEEVRKKTLHGRVDEMIKGKKKYETTDILKPLHDGSPVSLVFIEGPPGIGKSTLAWELCRKWDRKQYDLAVLLRLREWEAQQFGNIAALFPHIDQKLQQSVANEVLGTEGKGVLIILDGYDELPVNLRHQGLLIKLLKGEVLPKCSILVTSRLSATRDLFRACRPQIQRHVKILGFTQEAVENYASSVFSSEPEVLKDFLMYISASKNPALSSLMYIPLNAAIIVEIYKNNRRKGCPIPKTMTQVYTQLCLTLLQRYLDSINSQDIDKFSDLPDTYFDHFKNLSQLAFENFQQHRTLFNSDTVSKELIHFGFLDSVPALYGGGGISYNFLHLTLQEFLAAYHVTQLSNGIDVFTHHSKEKRWEVVWRFVSGLTGFKYFENNVHGHVFFSSCDDVVKVKNLFLHCLFEGQQLDTFDFSKATGMKTIHSDQDSTSPLDRYALGYCIANCSSTTSWKVEMEGDSDESFMWGLNSNHSGNGTIICLKLPDISPVFLGSFPVKILHGIGHLQIDLSWCDKVIPPINNLTSLTLIDLPGKSDNDTELTSFSNLMHSPKLKCLTIGDRDDIQPQTITKPLGYILFGPSSVSELFLDANFEENSLDLLETNTNLTEVSLLDCSLGGPPFQTLSKILRNKAIQKLQIKVTSYSVSETLDLEQVDTFKAALLSNTSLEELMLVIDHKNYPIESCTHDWSFITDSRVTIECDNVSSGEVSDEEESSGEVSDEEGSDEEVSDEDLIDLSAEVVSDEEGSNEEGSDEEGSGEEGSDEEASDEEASVVEESDEEGSDEEVSGRKKRRHLKELSDIVSGKEVCDKEVSDKEVSDEEVKVRCRKKRRWLSDESDDEVSGEEVSDKEASRLKELSHDEVSEEEASDDEVKVSSRKRTRLKKLSDDEI